MNLQRLFLPILLAIPMLMLGSCNIVGPVAFMLTPEPEIDAEYILDDRPTVVFVDERGNKLRGTANRNTVGKTISQSLLDNEVVSVVFEPRAAESVARQEKHGEPMSLSYIGQIVGAEQLICVQVLDFQPFPTYGQTRPVAQLRVKVIDVPGRVRLFPVDGDEDWRQMTVSLPERAEDLGNTGKGRELETLLAREIGVSVARLFHDYNPRPLGRNLN